MFISRSLYLWISKTSKQTWQNHAVSVLVCGKLYGKSMENVWKKLWKTFPYIIKQTSVGLILGIKRFIF